MKVQVTINCKCGIQTQDMVRPGTTYVCGSCGRQYQIEVIRENQVAFVAITGKGDSNE